MKHLLMAILVLIAVACLTGCTDDFPDEEMHFGIEDKVRPYAVTINPPDAAPGQTVEVTLSARTPDPDNLDISWRVALDYDIGLYEADEVERNYRDLTVPDPVVDEDGFLRQTFQWVVPDSALLYSSALPAVLTDPTMVYLAEQLIGPEAGSPPTKSAVDAWLKSLTVLDLYNMEPAERAPTWALSDRFACQVRFRATLRTDQIIDVTKNLTVRHTERLQGPNANHNPRVGHLVIVGIEQRDAESSAINNPDVPKNYYSFIVDFHRVADKVQVPLHEDWTYYAWTNFYREPYTSPFDPSLTLTESGEFSWYYYRQDAPRSSHHFFVTDDGDEAVMGDLGNAPRIMPDGVGSTFRIVAVSRDFREDWVMYHATPGSSVEEGIIEFITPQYR